MQANGRALSISPTTVESTDVRPNPEVVPAPAKAKRRQFSVRFKLQVLKETQQLSEGEIGSYLRRHGLYWSHLSNWRRLQEKDALGKAEANKRGRKKAIVDPSARELAGLRKQLSSVEEQLRQANLILEVQKKVLLLCGDLIPSVLKQS